MIFLGFDRADDDVHILRNLHAATSRSPSSTRDSPKALLRSFVHELSFWGDGPSDRISKDPVKPLNSQNLSNSLATEPAETLIESNGTKQVKKSKRDKSQQSAEEKGVSESRSKKQPQPAWKKAVDPSTGRSYYYHTVTRKSQWTKPQEVKDMEKKEKLERRQRDREFFQAMEENVRTSMQRGELIPGIPISEVENQGPPQDPEPLTPSDTPRVRTISNMDDILMAELQDGKNGSRQPLHERQAPADPVAAGVGGTKKTVGRPPLPLGNKRPAREQDQPTLELEFSPEPERLKSLPVCNSAEPDDLAGENILDDPIQTEDDLVSALGKPKSTSPPAQHMRRNTGGTIYLQNTMTNPNVSATIKCVCGVFRAHIVQAAERQSRGPGRSGLCTAEFEVFYDDYGTRRRRRGRTTSTSLPSLAEVVEFYQEFYRRSQMEHDTIITSLIYVERLVKSTNGLLTPSPENWRSILFACMILASKVWDDLSMWNVDFSNVSAATAGFSYFSLARINQLESAILKALKFDVKVPASEYAKYYFLIRTMLIRSGLVKEEEKPLRKEQAAFHKLESRTTNYQDTKLAMAGRDNRRAKSMEGVATFLSSTKGELAGPVLRDNLCLEQLVG